MGRRRPRTVVRRSAQAQQNKYSCSVLIRMIDLAVIRVGVIFAILARLCILCFAGWGARREPAVGGRHNEFVYGLPWRDEEPAMFGLISGWLYRIWGRVDRMRWLIECGAGAVGGWFGFTWGWGLTQFGPTPTADWALVHAGVGPISSRASLIRCRAR